MALFDRLSERVKERASQRVMEVIERMELAWSEVPGARAFVDGRNVIVAARDLRRRYLSDARLRFARWRSQ
jgi:hypothetical protein